MKAASDLMEAEHDEPHPLPVTALLFPFGFVAGGFGQERCF
jgi:hypothetical protein